MMRYLVITLLCFILSSCGMSPLSDFEKNNNVLQQISLGKISGAKVYLIKNYLLNILNLYNTDSNKLYVLDVTIVSTNNNAVIQKDSTILEKTVNLNVTYILQNNKTLKEITRGNFIVRSNFVNTVSPYGSFIQENNAYEEALQLATKSIKRKLLMFFAKEHKNKK